MKRLKPLLNQKDYKVSISPFLREDLTNVKVFCSEEDSTWMMKG